MQFCFNGQIGRNLEVCIDDIIIKFQKSSNLISDLEETFNNLRWYTFGVPWGKC
jgi:hypothetical protein